MGSVDWSRGVVFVCMWVFLFLVWFFECFSSVKRYILYIVVFSPGREERRGEGVLKGV